MIFVHLINPGEKVVTLKYKKSQKHLEVAMRGRAAKMIIVSGLSIKECIPGLLDTMSLCLPQQGAIFFIDQFDSRSLYK